MRPPHRPVPLAVASFVAAMACAAVSTPPAPVTSTVAAMPTTTVTAGPTAFTVDSAVRALASATLWPRFDPLAIPLAVFDGHTTVLFRHPHPPAGYVSLSRAPGLWAREGRDPAVTANSSAPIDGVPTATVMLEASSSRPPAELGALAIHELFHVYQRRVHPDWTANEVDLFTYPVDDVTALALRREETFALGEARASEDADEATCWASAFTALRAARFARIGAAAAAYEQGTELNEGLAQYVELRSRDAAPKLPPQDFAADRVRDRAYAVGSSLAVVLDQLQPDWRDSLDRAPPSAHLTLDGMLASAARQRYKPGSPTCSARGEQRARWASFAAADIDTLTLTRARARSDFLAGEGWMLIVEASAAPLFPQGFDPLNVSRVSPTEILHSRFVKLGRDGATVEVLGRPALSAGVPGQHPLFNGVRTLTVTGLPSAPSMSDSAGVMLVSADGVHGRFPKARASTSGRTVRITLP